ncbi:MAG TPA: hypothetical protein VGB14_10370, partial [Acidimicrobiales bacterium]
MSATLPRPATAPELAVLRHPDRRTAWVVLACAELAAPTTVGAVADRLAALAAASPIVAARLRGTTWVPGRPPPVDRVDWDPFAGPGPVPAALAARFDLAAAAPVRVALTADGRRLAVAAHHAALDGLGVAAVVAALAGGEGAGRQPGASPPASGGPTGAQHGR